MASAPVLGVETTIPSPIIIPHAPLPNHAPDEPVTFLQPDKMQWMKIEPELGDSSPKITVVRHEPSSGATTLLIWTPRNFHVPRHWHTGNEKHVVLRGTFIFECQGRREVMKPGSFNYMPARMIHQAWTLPDEDCLLYTDVDRLWDLNWIDPPPGMESGPVIPSGAS